MGNTRKNEKHVPREYPQLVYEKKRFRRHVTSTVTKNNNNQEPRLRLSLTERRWQPRDWQRVVFAYESQYCFLRVEGRTAACCVLEVVPLGSGMVVLWGGICGQERTPLVIVNGNLTAQHYIDDNLHPTVLPFPQLQSRGVIYH